MGGVVGKFQDVLMAGADVCFSWVPTKAPAGRSFPEMNLISHRGQHDNTVTIENSLVSFDRAIEAQATGIEFDVRWTKDMEPVVFHDRSLFRVLGAPSRIEDYDWIQLRESFPQIPHLKEVVDRFSNVHLMIEIKKCDVDWGVAHRRLREILSPYGGRLKFHFMSLVPEIFFEFESFDKRRFLGIAKTNVKKMSDLVIQHEWGGLTGHYLLMRQWYFERHHEAGQIIGVGFPASLNSLFRELHRGADFVFTNHVEELSRAFKSGLHPL